MGRRPTPAPALPQPAEVLCAVLLAEGGRLGGRLVDISPPRQSTAVCHLGNLKLGRILLEDVKGVLLVVYF